MRLARISTLVAVCTVAASVATVPTTAAAAENSTLSCTSSVPIYRATAGGALYRYQHLEPENGTLSWAANPPHIGNDWHNGRAVAAPDGVFYAPWNTGELRRYRWINNAWETYPGGSQHQVIDATGWDRYTTAAYKNRITADTEGHLYTVEPDGALHWRAYDSATGTWRHRVIAGGWDQYNLITAAGRGVIYARLSSNGDLHRYRYHAASNRWVVVRQDIGKLWNRFDRVFSAGGDVLYAVEPDGEMFWYRWNETTETWQAQTGVLVGRAWIDWTTTAQPDACQRVGTSVPQRPTVEAQPNGSVTLLNTSDGHLHYGYVDPEGRATHAEAVDLSGNTSFGAQVVPGLTGVTATTAMGEYQDGRVVLTANGTDADVRESVRGADDVWSAPTNEGGFLVTAPAAARLPGNIVAEFSLAADYGLWVRRQAAANAPLGGWQLAGSTPLAHERLTAVATSAGVRLIGLGRDGRFHTATYENGTLGTWTNLGGSGFAGTASAVAMPGDTVQVFATDSTGTVQTQRQTTAGFPGTWTALPGVAAVGSPSAVMSVGGMLQVVTKGPGDYIYYSGQTAPGSTTWTAWQTITTSDVTSTDPTALTVPTAGTWVVAYLTDTNEPKLRRAPASVARSTGTDFVEVPIHVIP
ncbi:tachylectin-related carbohydrate-binding protein [Actinophytocola algeriensis]|uniref:Tachylectin 2 domain-containing protein n=1 Tax=Actinophytocola algeriensis TaxID=1768010 RepID=A0A7W7QGI2_9PSEU|nr:tachylectin-related carbohydrate-binding protein [Actinophytocola algeriensis]MBB4912641.1 hypothetical protein [Actinophytocola algeriensis]MBE1472025.1 hypothetical protein [Actinophytocola algeriensis]